MQFMSKSTNPNRPTRKKDRKVQRKFNSSLRSKVDDATRLVARTAKLAAAQKVLDDALDASTKAKQLVLGLVSDLTQSPDDQELQAKFKKQELAAAAAGDALVRATAAFGKTLLKFDTKNSREAQARLKRREDCRGGFRIGQMLRTHSGLVSGEDTPGPQA